MYTSQLRLSKCNKLLTDADYRRIRHPLAMLTVFQVSAVTLGQKFMPSVVSVITLRRVLSMVHFILKILD